MNQPIIHGYVDALGPLSSTRVLAGFLGRVVIRLAVDTDEGRYILARAESGGTPVFCPVCLEEWLQRGRTGFEPGESASPLVDYPSVLVGFECDFCGASLPVLPVTMPTTSDHPAPATGV